MAADRSNLVPEARIDKNGVTSTRWVNPEGSAKNSAKPLPAPAIQEAASPNEQQELYDAVIRELLGNGDKLYRNINVRFLEACHKRCGNQSDLYRTFLANVGSIEPFRFIEQVHRILDYHGADDIPSLVNDESLAVAIMIINSTEHLASGDGSILPEAVEEMIHYALTSDDMELIATFIYDRNPDTVAEVEGLVAEARRSQSALRSGVL